MLLFIPVLLGALTLTIIVSVMAFDSRTLAHASSSTNSYDAGNIDSYLETASRSATESDDFNACQLDTGIWTHIDPDGDSVLAMNYRQLSISIPPSTTHTIWNHTGNFFEKNAPRIMQRVNNTDFEIEVKFDTQFSQTLPSDQFQMQGVIIEEDFDDVVRFEFFRTGSNTRIFAATFEDGIRNKKHNIVITGTNPFYMTVARVNDKWTQSYSPDGDNWTNTLSFTHPMSVTAAGVYAGNQNAPNEVLIDYFYNSHDQVRVIVRWGWLLTPPRQAAAQLLWIQTRATINVSTGSSWRRSQFLDGDLTAGAVTCLVQPILSTSPWTAIRR